MPSNKRKPSQDPLDGINDIMRQGFMKGIHDAHKKLVKQHKTRKPITLQRSLEDKAAEMRIILDDAEYAEWCRQNRYPRANSDKRKRRNPDHYLYKAQGPLRDRTRFMVHEDTAAYEQVRTSSGWDTTKRVEFRRGDVFWGYPRGEYIHGAMDCRYRFPGHVLTMQAPERRNPPQRNPKPRKALDDKQDLTAFGYRLDARGRPIREDLIEDRSGRDHGSDPLGKNKQGVYMFRMVPSGDVVDYEERNRRLKKNPSRGRYLLLRRAGDYAVLDTLDRHWRSGATPTNWKDTGYRTDTAAQCMLEARRRQTGRQKGMDWARDRIGAKRRRNPDDSSAHLDFINAERWDEVQRARQRKHEREQEAARQRAENLEKYAKEIADQRKAQGLDETGRPIPKTNPSPRLAALLNELSRIKALLRRTSAEDAVVLRSAKRLLERRIAVMYRRPVRM